MKKAMEARYAFRNVDAWLSKTYDGFVCIFYTKITQYLLILLSLAGFGTFFAYFHQAVHLLSISTIKWTLLVYLFCFRHLEACLSYFFPASFI